MDRARFCRWVVFRGVPGINNVIGNAEFLHSAHTAHGAPPYIEAKSHELSKWAFPSGTVMAGQWRTRKQPCPTEPSSEHPVAAWHEVIDQYKSVFGATQRRDINAADRGQGGEGHHNRGPELCPGYAYDTWYRTTAVVVPSLPHCRCAAVGVWRSVYPFLPTQGQVQYGRYSLEDSERGEQFPPRSRVGGVRTRVCVTTKCCNQIHAVR